MIKYTEKGGGLHTKLNAAGHWLENRDGIWLSSNDAAVQLIIDGYTVTEAANFKAAAVDAYANSLREASVKDVSKMEASLYATKVTEARAVIADPAAFQANPTGVAPTLVVEATKRGVTVAALSTKVLNNFNAFVSAEANFAGVAGKHKDAIRALLTFSQIAAYDHTVGW